MSTLVLLISATIVNIILPLLQEILLKKNMKELSLKFFAQNSDKWMMII